MRPVIVKLGGSVITDKRKPFTVKRAVIRRLARELKEVWEPLVIVHGGGSFGHPLALKYRIAEGYRHRKQLIGISHTHLAMERLNRHLIEALQSEGIPAMACQPSACTLTANGRIESMDLRPLRKMLALGLVPVLYGDVVLDAAQGVSILSGDQMVSYLARKLGASRVVLGVDVDGVFTSCPKKDSRARLLRVITPEDVELVQSMEKEARGDVTGGMRAKVQELLELARLGIEAEIVNAARPNVLREALKGKRGLGTMITGGK
ncbi:MAG: isopentenyl phosphate kinase [Candidatus Hadarchaeum sp.]|uniref:isopentenyl phosphate kinase n=1 Tax=Candidatus Hadarchaeum sp. TaxID=2883567 RepID=UPI003D12EFAA